MVFSKRVINQAKRLKKRIAFPEGTDERVLKAVKALKSRKIVTPILIGNPHLIHASAIDAKVNLKNIDIIDPKASPHKDEFAQILYEKRKNKGLTKQNALKLAKNPLFHAGLLLKKGLIDGVISGATHPTRDTIKAAIYTVGIQKHVHTASSTFFMECKNQLFLFSDCAFVIDPDEKQLAEIALETISTAKDFSIAPKVAMLSYSTKDSGQGPSVDKVKNATKIIKQKAPGVIIDGEMQFDAAYSHTVQLHKAPHSPLKGQRPNIFIFPNLDSANIGYKIAQRIGGAHAYGPIMQGFLKPFNDLSRGCSITEIIITAAITAMQAAHKGGEL